MKARACVYVCVCVCVRERERERECVSTCPLFNLNFGVFLNIEHVINVKLILGALTGIYHLCDLDLFQGHRRIKRFIWTIIISETRQTAGVLKQDPNKRFKRTLFIRTKTQSANFRGNPLWQATKRHLTFNRWKRWKMSWKTKSHLFLVGFCPNK